MSGITDFHGMEAGPSFDRARQLISTPFQYLDIALDTAGTNQIFNIAGDFLFFDVASTGIATMELNNQYNDPAAPFTVQANFAIAAVFKQIKLSWAAQAGKKLRIMFSTGDRVIPASSGVQSVTIAGTPSVLVSNSLTSANANDYSGTYKSRYNFSANTPDAIFSPAANTNGAILIRASATFYNGGGEGATIVAKATPPSNILDGDVLESGNWIASTTDVQVVLKVERPIKIPAGLGLYFICSNTESAGTPLVKSAVYKLL